MAKRAWLIFFALGVGSVLGALFNLRGHPPDPSSPEEMTGLPLDEISRRIPGIELYIGSISRQLGNFMLATGPDEELHRRRAELTPWPTAHRRGWPRLYQEHVTQAPDGCDFDFLEARSEDDLPFVPPTIGRS